MSIQSLTPAFRILCVCTGNICRSPTAEAVLRQRFDAAGLDVAIDSAGTHGYHIGSGPDRRSQQAGKSRGYDFTGQRARQVEAADFDRFDLILAMDQGHFDSLIRQKLDNSRAEIALMLSFLPPDHDFGTGLDVPDPYYGSEGGFEHVLDLIEAAADGLVLDIRSRLNPN
ncbi:MAG TPA: protein-tyrosine-phosphatase [Rhodospirillaceae bacterium]|nr:protein-tyrosine-phosphatase [Alphaproteobacteria bacterium]OUT41324.1 MAG: protein-tyrosine-phosphatase [Micavibrio sp. TMED2]HCI47811.1 protein-tyrosine-phosphatase [Rhodospirillaceae bacterium]MAS47148.1 protein-tyrosine-phosphatase [Alphaproteobacteria bacterium]MAX95243.1 protein-tyrosine-phosphatase [Alphaproteobacteria bacterium]|tara:strand:+ start:3419 stop:3928 length:510 start_codon:yes stop_codon:yes gene_type:complete